MHLLAPPPSAASSFLVGLRFATEQQSSASGVGAHVPATEGPRALDRRLLGFPVNDISGLTVMVNGFAG